MGCLFSKKREDAMTISEYHSFILLGHRKLIDSRVFFYQCKKRNDTVPYFIKKTRSLAYYNAKAYDDAGLEIFLLQSLDHRKIVKPVEYHCNVDTLTCSLVLRMYPCGDLFSLINGKRLRYNSTIIVGIVSQMLSVLFYLKEKQVVHRDISPENIVVCSISPNYIGVNLIDFGLEYDKFKREPLF